ncbi:copper chaperone PCu(A)C [Nocardia cyriacigeorgica]|uniref:copper chaperone PCu(A)C n=1 Tax=Nocardia cyriacigeorgica TaxID=135487 RepID=UPI001893FB06|nr:copper chaperone PCu(A)C [Nocardia cyriacigeorgica]MBF6320627.1 copper chaperone PCu(A)C [Nocardia cyriacigeorgica]MBF6398871.1 copper chaperone PCu(A)C [Nocardia cyriacigeorgica]MBF6403615.1 copper chaperone PCu(A)C [Nocardia cyriacigeorgica]MBF6535079.1 copper chaperone PCu(A)C [Nocardia cyriacigeorgica]
MRRAATLSALAVLLVAAGCGTGDAPGESSSHAAGSEARTGDITLRNVHIVPAVVPGQCVIQADAPAMLAFAAVNNSPTDADRLVSIDTPAAESVRIQATQQQLTLRPETMLTAGQPVEQVRPPSAPDEPIRVMLMDPADSVRPGKHVEMTFTFDRSGAVTVVAPIDSCPTQLSE